MNARLQHITSYPQRYVEALRLRRRVARLSDELPFDGAFSLACEIGITQKVDEIRALFERLRGEPPRRVLEIGLDRGGTLFLWTRAAAPDAQLVAVDTCPLGPLGSYSPFAISRRGLARHGQRLDLVMPADSHDLRTRRRIEDLFGGEPIDFLFIDGDHTYEGVRRDFELYAPLVREGGLIALHDISPNVSVGWTEGTARYWQELASDYPHEELLAGDAPGFGIGIIRRI
jgi:predicted O-methyltransferase YrrM